MTLRATLLLFSVGTVWGASFLFIRVAVEEVQPLQVVFVRTFAGAVVMLLFLRAGGRPVRITKPNLGLASMLAVLAILIPFFLIAWAEQELDSGTTAVLNATMPLFTLFFAALLLPDERLTLARIGGVLLGLAGVVLLVGGGIDSSAGVVAVGAVVLASACYGLGAIGARVIVRRWSPLPLSTAMVSFTALYAGIIFFATGDPRWDVSLEAWGSMLVLGVAGTGAAYVAYYTLIDLVSSVRASFVAYIIPIVGVILGAAVLGESVTWYTVGGGFVILAGIALGTGLVRRVPADAGPVAGS